MTSHRPAAAGPSVGIADVERETGLGKDVLRAWEKRYGFPAPMRDDRGDRVYPADQVEKLHLLRRLVDEGHRPGQIVTLPIVELRALQPRRPAKAVAPDDLAAAPPALKALLDLLAANRVEELRRALITELMRLGIERFVIEVSAPLCALVGTAWARGVLQVFEEHLFAEEITRLLRFTLQSLQPAADAPRNRRPLILLTTLTGEPHAIGLLMAEALMSVHGGDCLSLGPQTPEAQIARAVRARKADILALSFSSWFSANRIIDKLARLRAMMPPDCEIWVGGTNPGLRRALPDGVRAITELQDIGPALTSWRQRHQN